MRISAVPKVDGIRMGQDEAERSNLAPDRSDPINPRLLVNSLPIRLGIVHIRHDEGSSGTLFSVGP